MSTSKVISIRIPSEKYESMLVECERKGITITELLERQEAVAKSVNASIKTSVELLEEVLHYAKNETSVSLLQIKMKLSRVIKDLRQNI
jgi:hypothetical protein